MKNFVLNVILTIFCLMITTIQLSSITEIEVDFYVFESCLKQYEVEPITPVEIAIDKIKIAFEKNIPDKDKNQFLTASKNLAKKHKFKTVEDFMVIFYVESYFKAWAVNDNVYRKGKLIHKGSKATGIFQAMPFHLREWGHTSDSFKKLSALEQLYYFDKYLTKTKKELGNPNLAINNTVDAYLLIFYPKAVGKPNSYKIGGYKLWKQNKILNCGINGKQESDHQITKGNVKNYINKKFFS